jgi:hypothetical protein
VWFVVGKIRFSEPLGNFGRVSRVEESDEHVRGPAGFETVAAVLATNGSVFCFTLLPCLVYF